MEFWGPVIFLAVLFIATTLERKYRDLYLPPSARKIGKEYTQYYYALLKVMKPFANCEFTQDMFRYAVKMLKSCNEKIDATPSGRSYPYDEQMEERYIHLFKSNTNERRNETWAMCFILDVIASSSRMSEYKIMLFDYFEEKIKSTYEYYLPLEWLYAFREANVINDLYHERLAAENNS